MGFAKTMACSAHLHYWAQNNQGVLIELGDPNNVTTFSESEIYHSLCALVKKKGYDPKDVTCRSTCRLAP